MKLRRIQHKAVSEISIVVTLQMIQSGLVIDLLESYWAFAVSGECYNKHAFDFQFKLTASDRSTDVR